MTKAAWLVTAAFVSTSFGCTVETDRPTAGNESTPRLDSSESKMPARCDSKPVARARADVKGVAFARGDGPVFVGLGTSNVVRYTEDTKHHAGWYYYKTLWAIAPEYRGAVVVTGSHLNGSNDVRFNPSAGFPGVKLNALEFRASETSKWRYGPSDTLIRADGCYAFRIEGEGFVEWVTFVAQS